MAEFVDVMENFNRMHAYELGESSCRECRISSYNNGKCIECDNFIKKYPQEAEEIIMDWAKEHPITNADKFKETFGFEPDTSHCPMSLYVKTCMGCDDCEYRDFWGQEYQEPKRDGE